MADEPEKIGECEFCSADILEGDAHFYTADGCWLCAEHSPMLSDAILQHQDMYDEGLDNFWSETYDSFAEMTGALLRMKQEYQERGDRSLASA